jgi:integrase
VAGPPSQRGAPPIASAWIFQKAEDVEKHGEDKASWYVGWYDPDGKRRKKSFGPGLKGKNLADRRRIKLDEELTNATYQGQEGGRKTWKEFREEYERRVLEGLATRSRLASVISLDHFERIAKPAKVSAIRTQTIDDFIAERRKDRGRRPGDPISPASINKDLRHLKAALAVAVEWGYLTKAPKVRMVKAAKKLSRYVPGEHFAAIYQACETARMPEGLPNISPADWWRALLAMGYMAGWRIGDMLALRRDQLDLDAGVAVSLEGDNKGKRGKRVLLHPIVVEHLRPLAGFTPTVLPWNHNERTLYDEFARIQQAAKINLPCPKMHEHGPHCYVYGFHDLRRAFATMNADRLTPDALQALMRHKSYQTTQLYINMARQLNEVVADLHVPDVLKRTAK